MDVNNGAEAAPADSSAAESQVETSGTQTTSAETLNTDKSVDKVPESIPYSRFKEVNDKAKKLEALEKYVGKEQMLDYYEQFDNLLAQNPELFKEVKSVLEKRFAQQNQAQSQPGSQAQGIDPTLQSLVVNNYMSEFNRLAAQDNIPEEIRDEYLEATKQALLALNPDPIRNYNPQSLAQAYAKGKERIEKMKRVFTSAYTKDKAKDEVPASTSRNGSAPVKNPAPRQSQNQRAQLFSELLKAGR